MNDSNLATEEFNTLMIMMMIIMMMRMMMMVIYIVPLMAPRSPRAHSGPMQGKYGRKA